MLPGSPESILNDDLRRNRIVGPVPGSTYAGERTTRAIDRASSTSLTEAAIGVTAKEIFNLG
jgi:hypothetical protein